MYYEFNFVLDRDQLDAVSGMLGGFLHVGQKDPDDPLVIVLQKIFDIAMTYHTPSERKELFKMLGVIKNNFTRDSLDKDLFKMGVEGLTRNAMDELDKKNL